jgi:hypothetical protein
MPRTKPFQAAITATVVATAGILAAAPTAPVSAESTQRPTVAVAPVKHLHTVESHPASGTFRCGSLRLTVNGGKEIETFDGDRRNGVTRVFISRISRHVTLRGSDGRTYRASSVVAQWDVLIAPDLNHPVRGQEVIIVDFRGGPDKSPGFLRERLTIRHSHERDVVTGPCDYA